MISQSRFRKVMVQWYNLNDNINNIQYNVNVTHEMYYNWLTIKKLISSFIAMIV